MGVELMAPGFQQFSEFLRNTASLIKNDAAGFSAENTGRRAKA